MKPTLKKVVTSLEDASLNSNYLPELFDALSSHLREEGCEKAADQATTLATLFYQKIRIEQARSSEE